MTCSGSFSRTFSTFSAAHREHRPPRPAAALEAIELGPPCCQVHLPSRTSGVTLFGVLADGVGEDRGVARVRGQQLVVGAGGGDCAVVEQDHPVGEGDGGEPVGDQDRGAVGATGIECGVDAFFDGDVDGAGGVVEDQNLWVGEQGSGDGESLTLTAGQGEAPFADLGVGPMLEIGDEVAGGSVRKSG